MTNSIHVFLLCAYGVFIGSGLSFGGIIFLNDDRRNLRAAMIASGIVLVFFSMVGWCSLGMAQ